MFTFCVKSFSNNIGCYVVALSYILLFTVHQVRVESTLVPEDSQAIVEYNKLSLRVKYINIDFGKHN
jgi:hypothetical protein